MEISIRGGGQTRSAFFFCILNSSRNALKKIFYQGGVPPKKNSKGPPFGYFGKIFKISKKSPIIKKSQGSPLWIFWEIFQNFKKISNNGLLLKKNKILFSILLVIFCVCQGRHNTASIALVTSDNNSSRDCLLFCFLILQYHPYLL